MSVRARSEIIKRLLEDTLGPVSPDEQFTDRPSERYLSGILFPIGVEEEPEEELSAEISGGEGSEDEDSDTPVGQTVERFRPSAIGLSFCVNLQETTAVQISISGGFYSPADSESGRTWMRSAFLRDVEVPLREGFQRLPLADESRTRLELAVRAVRGPAVLMVTVSLINNGSVDPGRGRDEEEQTILFQAAMSVRPVSGRILPKPPVFSQQSVDDRVDALIYRDKREYAVGHTCSADWEPETGSVGVGHIWTTWAPQHGVRQVDPSGYEGFSALAEGGDVFSADWLASTDRDLVIRKLRAFLEVYSGWIELKNRQASDLPEDVFRAQAAENIGVCRRALERMRSAVEALRNDSATWKAFRLANRAMAVQRSWKREGSVLRWRPFQLGFQLTVLESLVDGRHPDRATMDLLWFPTGGGKTEAYLFLVAMAIFQGRLLGGERQGVKAFMRYTLRLLTVQQFERASALIIACELIRKGHQIPDGISSAELGEESIGIGLWVGGGLTPNTIDIARRGGAANPEKLTKCPACGGRLVWPRGLAIIGRCNPRCNTGSCHCNLLMGEAGLPVWTIDEDVYRERPSLIIGTVDKFCQIARNGDTGALFGLDGLSQPPSLIIQDELHLISGPLGTLTAAYEIAIDEFCSRGGSRPKVIGSTATIRRAPEQIRAIFDRESFQFPPPCIDADDTCFSRVNEFAPERLYLGLTTAGRSPKFFLQAVCASLIQATQTDIPRPEIDSFGTLVMYFNSLRELGGALVMMQDDVRMTIDSLAPRRGEVAREIARLDELTSRKPSNEIPQILEDLECHMGEAGFIDAVLATNMISVGIDVSRLGVMLINGQPKGMSEYIQASSRVGRNGLAGLVVTIYNNSKTRDRSRYETFTKWHSSLYRDVEPTSVTPFAPRARERALHTVLVAMARHLVAGMRNSPGLDDAKLERCRTFVGVIVERARRIDPEEARETEAYLLSFLDHWRRRGASLRDYWRDRPEQDSLLISAEAFAAQRETTPHGSGGKIPALNSMRNVDVSCSIRTIERIRRT